MSFFGNLVKTVADVVTSPIEVVKDVATLGGVCTGEEESYTSKRIRKLGEDLENIVDGD